MSDGVLGPWLDASEEERRAIVAALQALADAEVRAVQPGRKPVVEVFAARRVAGTLTVHFLYDFRLQDEHHFHVGEAVCRDGAVVSHTIEKAMDTVSENEGAFQKRRAAALRAYWDEWMSLPFPFPGDPGP